MFFMFHTHMETSECEGINAAKPYQIMMVPSANTEYSMFCSNLLKATDEDFEIG